MKNIQSIDEFWGAVIRRDMSSAVREEDKFHNKEELIGYLIKEIKKQGKNVVIRNLDVSGIEDLSLLFDSLLDDVDNVETLDLSGWNTSGVKDISGIFYWCNSLKYINLSGWNTSDVKNMNTMFAYATRVKAIDFTGWNTCSVENMHGMFWRCESLKSLDLSGWNIDKVNDMGNMFYSCSNLVDLNLSGWETDRPIFICDMFDKCPAPYEVVDNKIVRK